MRTSSFATGFLILITALSFVALPAALAEPQQFVMGNVSRQGTNFTSSASEPSIAVGPFQVLTQQQGAVTAFTKDGLDAAPFTLNGEPVFSTDPRLFYGVMDDPVNPTFVVDNGGTGDPLMMYDPVAQRFYALAWSGSVSEQHLHLNISKSSDLEDGWYNYHLRLYDAADPQEGPDRPTLGCSADKIFITSWYWNGIVVFDKALLLSGQVSLVPHVYNGTTHYDLPSSSYEYLTTPATGYWARACANLSDDNNGYFIDYVGATPSHFRLGKLTGLPNNPGDPLQFEALPDAPASLGGATSARQKDPENANGWSILPIYTGSRSGLSNPYFRDGTITLANHEATPEGVNQLRVFQVVAETGAVTTDEAYGAPGVSYAFPAAVTDADGNLYVGFDASSETMYPSCYVTCRKAGEASLETPPVLIKEGEGAYQTGTGSGTCGSTYCRWGDFTGIALDECTPGRATAYYVGQWGQADSYRDKLPTWVVNFRVETPQQAGCLDDEVDWQFEAAGSTAPSARWDASMTWDPGADQLVMFGGFDGIDYLNDVWIFDRTAGTWTQAQTSGNPPDGRRRHTAVYDPSRSRLVVFGGEDATQRFNDVWALSLPGFAWSELSTTGGPPSARCSHAAVYDPDRDQMVVNGGVPWSPYATWKLEFPGNQWTEIAQGNTPTAFEGCSAVYDPAGERMLVFGGRTYVTGNPCPGPVDLNEVFSLDLTSAGTWQQLYPGGTTTPRAFAAVIYDPLCERLIVSGGVQDDVCNTSCGEDLEYGVSEVSALSLSGSPAWTTLDTGCYGPTARGHQAAAGVLGTLYVFGGGEKVPLGNQPYGTTCEPTYHDDLWRIGAPDVVPPATITDLQVVTTQGGANCHWTAPGDDGTQGLAVQYDFRYATSPITEQTFASATPFPAPDPSPPGTLEYLHVSGLTACTWYYFAVKAQDLAGNWSALGNVPHKQTSCGGGGGCQKNCPTESAMIDPSQPLNTAIRFVMPNPFSSSVAIHFSTEEPSVPELRIYDVAGRLVRSETLAYHPAGGWRWTWDGKADNGARARSGIYFIRLQAGHKNVVSRVVKIASGF